MSVEMTWEWPTRQPTEREKELIAETIAHWIVVDDNGSLEWRPCGPDCKHEPPK